MTDPKPTFPGTPPRRRLALDAGRTLVAVGLLAAMALGVMGQVVRDRSAAWGVLMYLPLPLIGVAAFGFDLIHRGRALSRRRRGARFALALVGLATLAGSSARLIGRNGTGAGVVAADPSPGREPAVEILHWNVVWGGGRRRSPERWASIRRTMATQGADILVLSEAPPDEWLDDLVADLGPAATSVRIENEPGASYWYRLAVCSARPVRLVGRATLRGGVAMSVAVGDKPGALRLLVVDGQSHPLRWRTPFLLDVARLCAEATRAGRPFDLVVGDFNCLARSIGFDALEAEGYALPSRLSFGWRGTFPSFLPVYDIDHVWVRRDRLAGSGARLFTNLASDHRGQVVRVRD